MQEAFALDYSWQTLLPSFVAISAAFLTRQVFFSLFAGIWVGAMLLAGGDLPAIGQGFLRVIDTYLLRAVAPEDGSLDHISVIIFTLLVGGMIGIISANGGMRGIVEWLARIANNARRGQMAAFCMGFVVFFDDYANTLIVGKTLRPLTDRLGISREKLAFIVDATAAPLSCIALVTTWIGFQVSLIDSALKETPGLQASAYELFIDSISYSFYPILMLIFIALIIISGRDFGPMHLAELQARKRKYSTKVANNETSERAINAAIPIGVLIISTICSLYVLGEGESLRQILGSADPFTALLWASILSLASAVVLSLVTKVLSASEVVVAMEEGFKPMLTAVMILTFAWAIADINSALGTADYIVAQLGDALEPALLPSIIFIIAAICAFATGSSWGTMGILVPLVVPLTINTLQMQAVLNEENMPIVLASLAAIMGGAVWGDHCSPISDTTILSSLASDCPHMAHVQTQMPYALCVAMVALFFGTLPAGYLIPVWLIFPVCGIVIWLILRQFGKETQAS